MYRNIKEYDVRYLDTDAYDIIKPSSLLGLLQESAGYSADELGFGYSAISPRHIGFILTGWYVELYRPIKQGEKLCVHTWPVKPRSIVVLLRDYELYVGDEKVGVATSRWCMMDVTDYRILSLSELFDDSYYEKWNTERSIDFNGWKLRCAPEQKRVYGFDIGYSDYDHYFHVNNTKYADYLLDAFSDEDFKGKYISKLQIAYVKQCKLGERLELYRGASDGGYIVEGRVGDERHVIMKVELNEV